MKAKMKKVLKSNKGFTMIELMVVIVIMLILAAIAIPSFNRLITNANEAAATAEARTVLMLAQLEADTVAIDTGVTIASGDEGDLPNWTSILDDSGITDATEQGYFSCAIVDGVVSVTYDNNSNISVTLP